MLTRRRIFSFLGLAPVVGVGAIAAHASQEGAPIQKDYAAFALCGPEKKFVSLDVGQDNHLWVRINNKWQRVVTE